MCSSYIYLMYKNYDELLRNCEQNQPLYEAVNGDELEIAIFGQMITLGQLLNDPISVSCVHLYTTLPQACTLGVSCTTLVCTLVVGCTTPACTLGVSCTTPACTLGVRCTTPACTLGVSCTTPVCTLVVGCITPTCTLGVSCTTPACTLVVHLYYVFVLHNLLYSCTVHT